MATHSSALCLLCIGCALLLGRAAASIAPIIGILGLPASQCDSLSVNGHSVMGTSCFATYYVKWIESGGGQVVPLHHNLTDGEIDSFFGQLNGVLFTGGELDLTLDMDYVRTAKGFYDRALARGDYFPIWGTCQGFQMLNIITAWNTSVLCDSCFVGVDDIPLALQYTNETMHSRMFKALHPDIVRILGTENVTENLHVSGITPATHMSTPALRAFYRTMSTNVDANGHPFISTMEAYAFPIYGVQWHPERPQFDWNPDADISHTKHAIEAMQAMANFFVDECRLSQHTFNDPSELQSLLIYNFAPINHGYGAGVYFF